MKWLRRILLAFWLTPFALLIEYARGMLGVQVELTKAFVLFSLGVGMTMVAASITGNFLLDLFVGKENNGP
ncbi:MAG: hypothetical protein PHV42_00440 [Candidatus Pacebacteria bacterium]|nr:hypothetical protein [Candidatus Paceibacterota bacterium]